MEKEIADLQEQSAGMKAHWQREKDAIGKIRGLKEQIEQTRFQEEEATRKGDLGRASELKYSVQPELEKELQSQKKMLKEEIEAEDIAEVVGQWTGIPVSRLMEGEVEKLLHVEDRLRQRVVGQDEALRRRQPTQGLHLA